MSAVSTQINQVLEEVREVKKQQVKASQGFDSSEHVLTALKTAKSVGDLRCAIRRAEETQIPESDVQCFREQLLPQMVRAEEEKATAAEQRRVEEKRALEARSVSERKVLEKKIQEASSKLSQREGELAHLKVQRESEVGQLKAELKKEENAVRQMSEEMNNLETQRNEIQVRFDSLRPIVDQKGAENNELKKQNGSLKEDNKQLNSQLQVFRNQHQQQAHAHAETIETLRKENEHYKFENRKLNDQAREVSVSTQKQVATCEQENINLRQRAGKAETSCQALGEKKYGLEVKLRKAHWSSTNPSPHDFVNMARKREHDDNLSQKVGNLTRKNGELQTVAEQTEARCKVLWKYLPSDKEAHIRQEFEALRQNRNRM